MANFVECKVLILYEAQQSIELVTHRKLAFSFEVRRGSIRCRSQSRFLLSALSLLECQGATLLLLFTSSAQQEDEELFRQNLTQPNPLPSLTTILEAVLSRPNDPSVNQYSANKLINAMESSCRFADLRKPLLDLEEVAFGVPVTQDASNKNELDMTHHVSSISAQVEEEDLLEEEASSSSSSSSWTEEFMMWVILPTLLFSQFGMAFLMHDDRTATMSWTVVNLSIALFVITAWFYRHACNDANVNTIVLLLMPEILMDVVLGLVLFNKVALGFMVLLLSMLFLSTFVVVRVCHLLYQGRNAQSKTVPEPEETMVCQVV